MYKILYLANANNNLCQMAALRYKIFLQKNAIVLFSAPVMISMKHIKKIKQYSPRRS